MVVQKYSGIIHTVRCYIVGNLIKLGPGPWGPKEGICAVWGGLSTAAVPREPWDKPRTMQGSFIQALLFSQGQVEKSHFLGNAFH